MDDQKASTDVRDPKKLVSFVPDSSTCFVLSDRALNAVITALAAPARDIPALRKLFASKSVLER